MDDAHLDDERPAKKFRVHPAWLIAGFFAVLIIAQAAFYAVAFSLPSDALPPAESPPSTRSP